MNIAILGGGFTGLSAAHYLKKNDFSVTLFEREPMLGGLASGFKEKNWNWFLERAYHHIFSNDTDIINFSQEIRFTSLLFKEPITASLYKNENNYRIIPVDTPQEFLKFPLLSMPEKIRSAAILGFLKLSPFLTLYEKYTAKEFLQKTTGERAWKILWEQLFRKKFGKYAENILTSFIWARISKRTKQLGYMSGGFQNFIQHIELSLTQREVIIKKNTDIKEITYKNDQFIIEGEKFDRVISTLPTLIFVKIFSGILPKKYCVDLQKIQYLSAVNYIFETEELVLENTYWLSNAVAEIPYMVTVAHTNFIDKANYGNKHITYIAKYVENDDSILKMNSSELKKFWIPYLEKSLGKRIRIIRDRVFKSGYAQPIFDKTFLHNKPDFITPIKNLYCANLDMTYPYDRGTNYAVKLGKEISEIIKR